MTELTEDQNADKYLETWKALAPDCQSFFDALVARMKVVTGLDPMEDKPIEGGDEEFKLSMTWDSPSGDEDLAGVDLILADAFFREGELNGFNVMVETQGYGGESLGQYVPYNYTPDCFTFDVDELKHRLTHMTADIDEVVAVLGQRLQRSQQNRPVQR